MNTPKTNESASPRVEVHSSSTPKVRYHNSVGGDAGSTDGSMSKSKRSVAGKATKTAGKAGKAVSKAAVSVGKMSKEAVQSLLVKDEEYTWEKLQEIEKRRRNILTRCELPFWSIMSYWDGTVLTLLVEDSLFWLTILFYIGVRMQSRFLAPEFVTTLGSGQIGTLGGFLTFFLVLYVNKNNDRYFGLYKDSMAAKGRIFDVASVVTTCFPRPAAIRIVRYMNAAHIAGYVGLSKHYPRSTFFAQLNADLGLLTDAELARMDDCDLDKGGACNRELIAWCMMEIQQQQSAGTIDNEQAQFLRDKTLQLQAAVGSIYNADDLPIPFFYVHFICLLTALYLPLYAVSTAYQAGAGEQTYWASDLISGLVVILQAVFVIGLRILGQQMSNPYGDDLIDLSVIHYCVFTWRMSNRILNAQFPNKPATAEEEYKLMQNRISLGSAWENDEVYIE